MQLDEWFKLHYRLRKSEVRRSLVAGERPLLVRIDRDLLWLHEGTRRVATILDEEYDRQKALGHLPIALFLWAIALVDRPIAPEHPALLAKIADDIRAARDARPLGADEAELVLLDACDRFVATTRSTGVVRTDLVRELERATEASIRACILAATRRELHNLHAAVKAWTSALGPSQWDALRVVVCAGHQARYRQSTRSYFLRLLDEEHGDGASGERRVIYAENCRTEDEALDLVATHLLDREIGAMFMDGPLALQQDVLGEATRVVLDEIGVGSRTMGRFRPHRAG